MSKHTEENVRTKEKRNYKLNLRITDAELETLNSISFEDDEPVSQVVRKAIKVYNTLRKNKNRY